MDIISTEDRSVPFQRDITTVLEHNYCHKLLPSGRQPMFFIFVLIFQVTLLQLQRVQSWNHRSYCNPSKKSPSNHVRLSANELISCINFLFYAALPLQILLSFHSSSKTLIALIGFVRTGKMKSFSLHRVFIDLQQILLKMV